MGGEEGSAKYKEQLEGEIEELYGHYKVLISNKHESPTSKVSPNVLFSRLTMKARTFLRRLIPP